MPTLQDIITGIRELSFDRFSTPVFFIKSSVVGQTVSVSNTVFTIKNSVGATVDSWLFSAYPTLKQLSDAIIGSGRYQVSFNAYFTGQAESTMLMPLTNVSLGNAAPIFKQYFYTDNEIKAIIKEYYAYILGYECANLDALELSTDVEKLKCPRPHHLMTWCAYWAVDKRRLSEVASIYLDQSAFTGSGNGGMYATANSGANVTVQIGDVFTLQESGDSQYNDGERPWAVGADNVLGDANTFWYKVSLWLRKKLEDLFGDYSLRSSNVMQSQMILEKDSNFYAYFDSFPWTISPYTRGVLPGGNTFSRSM